MQNNEYHVTKSGNDLNSGLKEDQALLTIQAAANLAIPGDTIWVHEGVYREAINPPRGGLSDDLRISYQAFPGDCVEIKGSELAQGWQHQDGDVWLLTLPNDYFGTFNPYANLISGDWFLDKGRKHHTGAVYLNDMAFNEASHLEDLFEGMSYAWFAKSKSFYTRIWATFPNCNPNEEFVEINKRKTVFYPSQPGINFITVSGFTLSQAATPWSPPTTEQIGLIGVNWSKGWIIEHNRIKHSRCTGITLGKYFDREDGQLEFGFNAHYQTVERVLAKGDWTKENIGGHIIRHNYIAHCEQAGIVGSHGGAFCTIENNVIHDIHARKLFSGLEMAGIKLHAPVDTLIQKNLIYNCNMGVWLDWMTQGARVSQNVMYDNADWDLFIEIAHGPHMVDHNFLLSKISLHDSAQGGAYVHNLFAGEIKYREEAERSTQYFEPHSTTLAGTSKVSDGDERFYNNIIMHDKGLAHYDEHAEPITMAGNVFLFLASPSKLEKAPLCDVEADTRFRVIQDNQQVKLLFKFLPNWGSQTCPIITSELLGKTLISQQLFEQQDGAAFCFDKDFKGIKRTPTKVFPGPIQLSQFQNETTLWEFGDHSTDHVNPRNSKKVKLEEVPR
ncbi:MAG: right-handed parallel beta-helix repeat-containing protein [Lentisphaeria bacterium]|nr:right-handed parallel beta-helix repeat-containing protein [Lentisphaeria bacterium]